MAITVGRLSGIYDGSGGTRVVDNEWGIGVRVVRVADCVDARLSTDSEEGVTRGERAA